MMKIIHPLIPAILTALGRLQQTYEEQQTNYEPIELSETL